MSNVKEVVIRGEIPFHCGEQDQEMMILLGQLNMPSMGLQIKYGHERFVSNEHGGQTAMYAYAIEGQEAVSVTWLQNTVKTLRRIGRVELAEFCDIENDTPWETL